MMESTDYTPTEAALEQLKAPDRAYLAAMAEAVAQEQNDFTASAPTSPSQKRKRGPLESSPVEPRRAKRGAPAPMSGHPDADPAAYAESAVEAAQAAAAANVSAADFSALQQATTDHHEAADPADPANASSTAAAALGTMYPTIHVPPSTEETFAAQAASENDHQTFGSGDMLPADGLSDPSNPGSGQPPQAPPQNGIRTNQAVYQAPQAPKPAVGSEEWHKQRKDNHKEG
jgi:transcriptional regulator CBF1